MEEKLYIIKTSENYYKVGITKDVNTCLAQLQTGCPTPINVLKTFDVLFPQDTELHVIAY